MALTPLLLKEKNLWLGSQSPRRQEILSAAGFTFNVIVSHADEIAPDDMSVEKVPEYIAIQKSKDILPIIKDENALLITADTMVILEHEAIGKPKDYADALRILTKLSGQTHCVITGVCMADKKGTHHSFSTATNVTFSNLMPEEITYFVDTYAPFDKAGAYAVQEWIGYIGISRIEGCFYNIMGLPMHELYQRLKSL